MGEGMPYGGSAILSAGSRLGGYLLEQEIGAGGMAVVFRARDERLGRPVALKVLAPWLAADEGFRRRFLREARAVAAVDDPHIIPVYEAGEAGGVLFIAMRFVSGGDVRTCCAGRGRWPRPGWRRSSRRWRRRWTRRTRRGWCTVTLSRPTCCWTCGRGGPITCTCRISG